MVHIDNRILATKSNETGSFAEMWIDLEIVTWSAVSQKVKNKYCKVIYIYIMRNPETWY